MTIHALLKKALPAALLLAALGLGLLAYPSIAYADGGGWPTATPTATLWPTATPWPTLPPLPTPTATPIVLSLPTATLAPAASGDQPAGAAPGANLPVAEPQNPAALPGAPLGSAPTVTVAAGAAAKSATAYYPLAMLGAIVAATGVAGFLGYRLLKRRKKP